MQRTVAGKETRLAAQVTDGVAWLILDHPSRKNAIDLATWNQIANVLPELASDPDIRALVLTGAGENFSAGADITEFETVRRDETTARHYEVANSAAFKAVREAAVPTIAAIRGVCLGGGFGLAAAADLRIATPDATFAVPAARLGLAYPLDAMTDIVSSAGLQMARYLTYTAASISAQAALDCGFLLEIVAADQLDKHVSGIAQTIAANAPLSVRASKAAIATALSGRDDLLAVAARAGDATFSSEDYAEGRAAFRERRKPRFTGC